MRGACVGVLTLVALLAATPDARSQTAPLPPPRLPQQQAVNILLAEDGGHAWVDRYPEEDLVTDAKYESRYREWTVKVWAGPAGQIALGRVDDVSGLVEKAWTGPQVAWPMARGGGHVFGGKRLNSLP